MVGLSGGRAVIFSKVRTIGQPGGRTFLPEGRRGLRNLTAGRVLCAEGELGLA